LGLQHHDAGVSRSQYVFYLNAGDIRCANPGAIGDGTPSLAALETNLLVCSIELRQRSLELTGFMHLADVAKPPFEIVHLLFAHV
jgi:hypothetical protein